METLSVEYLQSYNGKELDLTSRYLSLDQIKALANNTTLRILNLSWNHVGDEGAIALRILIL